MAPFPQISPKAKSESLAEPTGPLLLVVRLETENPS